MDDIELDKVFTLSDGTKKTRKEISEMSPLPEGFHLCHFQLLPVATTKELIAIMTSPTGRMVVAEARKKLEDERYGILFDEFTSAGTVDAATTVLDLAVNPWKDLSEDQKERAKKSLRILQNLFREEDDEDDEEG